MKAFRSISLYATVFAAALFIGCAESPTSPSPSPAPATVVAATPTTTPTPSTPTTPTTPIPPTPSTVPVLTVTGPTGCVNADPAELQWAVDMTDAGDVPVRFVALTSYNSHPGCEATVDNPRSYVTVSGTTEYAAHGTGKTTFTFDPKKYDCGRVQVDVSLFDSAGGETLLVGTMVDYGAECKAPIPPTIPPGTPGTPGTPDSPQTPGYCPVPPPSLGAAEGFATVGASTVTNTGPTILTGDLGLYPGTSITGFPPGTVLGTTHATDAVAIAAQNEMATIYNSLASRAPTANLTGQDLGGLTLVPGVYTFASAAQLTGTLTLDAQGNDNAIFVFQIGSALTTASGSNVRLINGGSACNVFWQVGSSATLGTSTAFTGNIVALASVTLNTTASLDGRALARTGAVTFDTNRVSLTTACGCR